MGYQEISGRVTPIMRMSTAASAKVKTDKAKSAVLAHLLSIPEGKQAVSGKDRENIAYFRAESLSGADRLRILSAAGLREED